MDNGQQTTDKRLDLASIRARLKATQGSLYWRSLEELAETEDFQEFLHREFPQQAAEWPDPVSRRQFLRLMGASLALAGLNACARPPDEKIVPYVRPPEEIVPGKPLFFATAMSLGGFATGLLVESHMGRPTKIEGNPDHPASLGATDVFAQASVLTLYDPDRSETVTYRGDIRPWEVFLAEFRKVLAEQRKTRGTRLRILTETVTSPTLAHQLQGVLTMFPSAKWHQYEPVGRDNVRAGAKLAFGEYVETQYRFDKAEIVLALGSDFLTWGPGSLRYTRDFVTKRRMQMGEGKMNRLYVVECTPSNTGAVADHRLPLRADEIEGFARAVAVALGVEIGALGNQSITPPIIPAQWIGALVRDLQQHRGTSLILVGPEQPPLVHALAHAMNHALGNVGNTVVYTDPVEANPVDQMASLRELVQDMDQGLVDVLVILGGNPAYTAPADLPFGERLAKVGFSVHLSLYEDETSVLCHWHIPEAHYLESWSDTRAYDGTITILQPLIAPLYGGKTAHEVLAAFTDKPEQTSYDIVRDYWKSRKISGDFEQFWRTVLNAGFIPDTALPPKSVSLKPDWVQRAIELQKPEGPGIGSPSLEIVFQPDPCIWDGRFANNGWLQELPKPLTKLTWDNAALISPATAERLGLSNEDVVKLIYRGRVVSAPVWIMPGHADHSVTVHLGYGRTRAGRVGTGQGFNAYVLRTSDGPWFGSGLEIQKTGQKYPLACTQMHHSMEGRNLVRSASLEQYRENPNFVHEGESEAGPYPSLYPEYEYKGYAWGMAIDLSACVGCNACIIACQSENNIPIVGKDQVMKSREMHWLRIDRYYAGGLDNPETYYQPVLCMQCEKAPCEVVCPVAATSHSAEGLNDMVYNRCVGTRYCSNNCPYKVRRFNFLQYSDWNTPSLKLLRNPDVTVRSRGVMEKCTYCVQRINAARIEAEKEGRQIRDGEILTACQAVCPADAIVFGNINDPNSRVSKLKAEPRNYGLLAELNTKPRTTYLAVIRNPNPEMTENNRG
ncbi:MAG TPA: TAT-variant-translocated molybdopterin oxidoreductase [Candidatus Limnocylindrales bacterium]|nr:TAT-variant-translocated molybdopterin oxidoreductase [Candidatus Limnocylindrales bacterium]